MKKQLIQEAFRLQTLAGLNPINERGKDYDGDGKIESPEEEYKGSRDKAIKKSKVKEYHFRLSTKNFKKIHDLEKIAYDKSKSPQEREAALEQLKALVKHPKPVSECWECDQEEGEKDFTRGHDHEGYMAMSELKSLQSNSSRLMDIIGDDNAELPGWVSTYISLAADYMNSVTDYLAAMEPETEEPSNY